MKWDKLMDAVGMIDDEIIEEADRARSGQGMEVKGRSPWNWRRLTVLAACLGLVILGGRHLSGSKGMDKLKGEIQYIGGGCGGYGAMVEDIGDFRNGNPYDSGLNRETMPVYRGSLMYSIGYPATGLSYEEMMKMLETAADNMGEALTDVEEIRIEEWAQMGKNSTDMSMYDKLVSLRAEFDGGEIIVTRDGQLRIAFDEAVALPEEYEFKSQGNISDEEALKTLDYLCARYDKLTGFENPRSAIVTDGNVKGEKTIEYRAYDGKGEYEEDIFNWNFARVKFIPDDEGRLKYIDMDSGKELEKTGDYPVITEDEALQILINSEEGRNLKVTEKSAELAELVYAENEEGYRLPYYVFYVKEPEEKEEGVTFYKGLTVPAIKSAYLE